MIYIFKYIILQGKSYGSPQQSPKRLEIYS
jgi:hypothetical protein